MTTPHPQFDQNRLPCSKRALAIRSALVVVLLSLGCAASAVVARKAHTTPASTKRAKTSAHFKGHPVSRSQRNAAPDISPERGTAAAEAAQATLAETPQAPFLYPHELDPFFRALAAQQAHASGPNALSTIPALASTVRVLQFGDSHTAADIFTGAMRAQLQGTLRRWRAGIPIPGAPVRRIPAGGLVEVAEFGMVHRGEQVHASRRWRPWSWRDQHYSQSAG